MAKPVIAWRASVYSTTPAATVYTASPTWTPAANSLIVAFVVGSAASPADPTGVTAHGLSLTKLTLSQNSLSTVHFLSIWVGNAGASPTSAAAEGTWAGNQTGGSIVEFEITGWESSEPVQNAFGRDSRIDTATAATGTTGTVNISLRPDVTSEHVLMSFWLHLANEATTPRTNWTETAGADGNFNNPAQGVEVQFRTDAFEQIATATWSTSIDWRGYALVVRGTATTPKEIPKISDTVTARLNPDPINPGNENLKITDTLTPPVLVGGNLAPPTLTETLKLADGGVATQQGIVQLLGVVHVQDQLTPPVMDAPPSGDLGPPTLSVEALNLADSVTVLENPLQTSVVDEVLHIVDTVTVLENPLQTSTPAESLKIQDQGPTASMGDLTIAVTTENIEIADGGVATQQGIVQLLGVIHVQDTVIVAMGDNLVVTVAAENLKVQDSVTTFVTPLLPSTGALTETLYLDDIGLVAAIGIDEVIHVVDILTPPVLVSGGLGPPTISVETLKIQDTATVRINPLNLTLTDESLKVQDSLAVSENPFFAAPAVESLKVQDILSQPTFSGGELTVSLTENLRLNDQSPFIEERLRVVDTVTAAIAVAADLGPPTIAVESLKVQDTLTVVENPLLAAPSVDSLKVQDQTPPQVQRIEAGDLTPPTLTENLKLADTVTVFENPLFAASAVESLKVQDQTPPQVQRIEAGDLTPPLLTEDLKVQDTVSTLENELFTTILAESLKVQDSASVSENPLQTSTPAESLKVQDTLTTSMGGLVVQITPDELLHVQDMLLASMGGLVTAVTENLKIQDAIANITLNPEQTTLTVESLKVADTVSVGLELSVSVTNEALKVQDTVSAATGRAVVVTDESLKIQDSLSASLTVLRASPAGEALKIQDSVSLGVDLLSVVVGSEVLHIQDIWVVTATPDVVVRVRPDVEVIHIRPDTGTVRV